MTHKTRDCVERPRKLGAKWTNEDIKPDEVRQRHLFCFPRKANYAFLSSCLIIGSICSREFPIIYSQIIRDVSLDFEGKRDRWNGYDPEMYNSVMAKFKAAEEIRLRKEAEMAAKKTEEEKEAEAQAAAGSFQSKLPRLLF